MKEYKILGYSTFTYTRNEVTGHNCNFTYTPIDDIGYKIYGKDISNNEISVFKLTIDEDQCGSGYCGSMLGFCEIQSINKGVDYNELIECEVKPEYKDVIIDVTDEETIENIFFSVSYDGGDEYYPSGGISIDEDKFKSVLQTVIENLNI